MNKSDRDILKERRFAIIETEFRILKKIVPASAGLILVCIAVFFGITLNNVNSKVDGVIEQSSLERLEIRGQGLVDSMRVDKDRTLILKDSLEILFAELEEMRDFVRSGKRHFYVIDVKHNQIVEPPFGEIEDWEIFLSPTLLKSDEPFVEIIANVKKKRGHWLIELISSDEDKNRNKDHNAKAILIYRSLGS